MRNVYNIHIAVHSIRPASCVCSNNLYLIIYLTTFYTYIRMFFIKKKKPFRVIFARVIVLLVKIIYRV